MHSLPEFHISFADALLQLDNSNADAVELYRQGNMRGVLLGPGKGEPWHFHTQDGVYTVMCGSGEVVYEEKVTAIGPGDFLFMPSHVPHRFINYTADLLLWAVFCGEQ